jgi:hypothetical protein
MSATTLQPKKLKQQAVKNGQNPKEVLTPFEKDVQFATFINFQVEGQSIGAYLARRKENDYKLTFAFDCRGVHPTLSADAVEDIFERLEGGFKDLPEKESLTIHLKSFSEDIDRQLELSRLIERVKADRSPSAANSKLLRGLIYSKKERIQALRENGLRKPKKLTLYCTYTYESNEGERDAIEKSISTVLKFFRQNVTGEYSSRKHDELLNFLSGGYQDGLKQWQLILSNKMGLTIVPQTVDRIWADLWGRFNQSQPIPIPQYLTFNGEDLQETINSQVSPISLLMESETSIPVASRNYVHCNGKYQAVLLLADKPVGFKNDEVQLRYLWELVADQQVYDTEIIAQVVKGNQALLQDKLSTLTKQSIGKVSDAANQGTVSVGATIAAERAVEAQRDLFEGAIPLRMSLVCIIHRDEPQELEDACRALSAKLLRPAWLVREIDYPWLPWLQTFPGLRWDLLYAEPYDRRFNVLTSEVSGFVPLVKTVSQDSTGFELIAAEGNAPIHIDLYTEVKNVGVFATKRGGKSVLVSDMLTDALCYGMPVSILDYPREDGTGTFSEYVPLLDGAYFNIATECLNLFELPQLKQFAPEVQAQRLADFQDSLLEILQTMVLGTNLAGKTNQQEVRSILNLAMAAFFEDVKVQRRYNLANTHGFGSEAWAEIPTLKDFIGFCTIGRLKMSTPTPQLLAAIEYINLRLDSWLESRIGRALSSPSTFKSDSQLFAVAMANLANQEDAAIIAMATNLVILRRSLGFERSIVFIDEAPILFSFEAIAEQIGKFFANGAKSGIGIIISAQEPKSIAQTKHGAKVFDNLNVRLIGRIQSTAIDNFVDIFKIPRSIVSRCAGEGFYPKKEGFYSQWILSDGLYDTPCRYYPSFLQLATVANNMPETAVRLKHLREQPNIILALLETAKELFTTTKERETAGGSRDSPTLEHSLNPKL